MEELHTLYVLAWQQASQAERDSLTDAAQLDSTASPSAVFTTIAARAERIDPTLTTHLWHELSKARVKRVEIGDVVLSTPVARALEFALAYELGQRIDRVIAELGGMENDDITQEELEVKARAAGLEWHVIAYALSRGKQM
jgi:hypothetical protein